jgi:sulfur-oxidizing protein SoxZ
MSKPMKVRARSKEGKTDVRILIAHDMETGRRETTDGKIVPAHFIQHVTVRHGKRVVLSSQWGPAVSKNPYIGFRFQGGKPGETIEVTWVDNKGAMRTDQAVIT